VRARGGAGQFRSSVEAAVVEEYELMRLSQLSQLPLTWRKLHKIDQVQAIYVSCGSQGSVVIPAIKELRAMSLKTPDKV